MKNKRHNRVLYVAGAVLFAGLFVDDGLDLLMRWDSLTKVDAARCILHLPFWLMMICYCVSEYRKRKKAIDNAKQRMGIYKR